MAHVGIVLDGDAELLALLALPRLVQLQAFQLVPLPAVTQPRLVALLQQLPNCSMGATLFDTACKLPARIAFSLQQHAALHGNRTLCSTLSEVNQGSGILCNNQEIDSIIERQPAIDGLPRCPALLNLGSSKRLTWPGSCDVFLVFDELCVQTYRPG